MAAAACAVKRNSVLFKVTSPRVPRVPPKRTVPPATRPRLAKVRIDEEFPPALELALIADWPTPNVTAPSVSELDRVAAREVKVIAPPFSVIAEAAMRSVNAVRPEPAAYWRGLPRPF